MGREFLHDVWLRIKAVLKRQQLDRDLVEELEFHLSMREQKLIDQGLSPAEAHRAARRGFGNASSFKESIRMQWSFPSLESWWHDVRFSLRQVRRNPGFAALAILTLGVGIGATTAIYDVLYCGVLHPFPYVGAERTVVIESHDPAQPRFDHWLWVSPAEYFDIREQNHVFESMIGGFSDDKILSGKGLVPDWFTAMHVDPDTLSVMGMKPMIGRPFTPADAKPGSPPVVILANNVWRKSFGAEPRVIGQTVLLDHTPTTIVGVMPPRMKWYAGPAGWLPGLPSRSIKSGPLTSAVIGQLKPGVTLEQASAELSLIVQHLEATYPDSQTKGLTNKVKFLNDAIGDPQSKRTLNLLMGGVGLLLLIACVNVANLLLSRATVREKELALRMSLGAGRWRLIRQVLIETFLLGIGGALLGSLLAWFSGKGFTVVMPSYYLPSESEIRMQPLVFAFAAGMALLATLLTGLAPALLVARENLQAGLRANARGAGETRNRSRARNLLVAGEVAVSLILLIGAGMLARSFWVMTIVREAYPTANLLQVETGLPDARYKTAELRNQYHLEALRRIRSLPGITSAALGWPVMGAFGEPVTVEVSDQDRSKQLRAGIRLAGDEFFQEWQIPILAGHPISRQELEGAKPVAVVDRTFVSMYLGGKNPIGQRIKIVPPEFFPPVKETSFEVVGEVADTYHAVAGEMPHVEPQIYIPDTAAGIPWDVIFTRTVPGPTGIENMILKQLAQMDPESPVKVEPSQQGFENWYEEPQFVLGMVGAFAFSGLSLVCIGVYSVLSYSVSQRRHEIGVRMALGAVASDVRLLVVKAGLYWVLVGEAIGVPASLLLIQIFRNRIWGFASIDPLSLLVVSSIMLISGIAACYFPARRATKVDPIVSLRCE